MKKHVHNTKTIAWVVLLGVGVFLIALAISAILSRYALSVSRYELREPGLTGAIRIVQLSDLHNSEFGKENVRLTAKVAEQEPDLILVTGDLLNENEEGTEVAVALIRKLAKIAPVYISYGNHEIGYERRFDTDLKELFSRAGAVVLDGTWEDVTVNGQELRIGGIFGYCLSSVYLRTGEARLRECAFLEAFLNTDRKKAPSSKRK